MAVRAVLVLRVRELLFQPRPDIFRRGQRGRAPAHSFGCVYFGPLRREKGFETPRLFFVTNIFGVPLGYRCLDFWAARALSVNGRRKLIIS